MVPDSAACGWVRVERRVRPERCHAIGAYLCMRLYFLTALRANLEPRKRSNNEEGNPPADRVKAEPHPVRRSIPSVCSPNSQCDRENPQSANKDEHEEKCKDYRDGIGHGQRA